MKEEKLTAKDSLDIITQMIETRKNNWKDNGHILRFWGWLVLAASIGHFIFASLEMYNFIWLAWSITIIGGIYTFFYFKRLTKKKGKGEFLDNVSGFIWWIFAANAFTIGFGFTFMWGHLTTSLILIILGISAAFDGKIMRFKPMIIGGIITNFLGIFSTYWILLMYSGKVESQDFLILLLGLGIVCTNIIPGYIIKAQSNEQKNIDNGKS